jgi:threonine dehydrogenase-like Zn-dependent dehydrogenase
LGPQHYHNDAIGRHGQHADIAEYSSVEKIDPKLLITHRFRLENILDAYETLGSAANTKALKVIIEA